MGQSGQRRDVHHDAAHVQRKLALGNDLAGGVVNQDFFAALRVKAGQGADLHALVVGKDFRELFDAVGLIVLDADDDLLDVQPLLKQPAALDDFVGAVDHRTVVAGDVALALRGVDDDLLDAGRILNIQLDRRGERGTAQADHTAVQDRLDKAGVVRDHRRRQIGRGRHGSVGFDLHSLTGRSHELQHRDDFLDRSGNAGMYRRSDVSAGHGDQRTDIHVISGFDHAVGRTADAHAQGNGHHGRGRHPDRRHLGCVFSVRDMHPAQKLQ